MGESRLKTLSTIDELIALLHTNLKTYKDTEIYPIICKYLAGFYNGVACIPEGYKDDPSILSEINIKMTEIALMMKNHNIDIVPSLYDLDVKIEESKNLLNQIKNEQRLLEERRLETANEVDALRLKEGAIQQRENNLNLLHEQILKRTVDMETKIRSMKELSSEPRKLEASGSKEETESNSQTIATQRKLLEQKEEELRIWELRLTDRESILKTDENDVIIRTNKLLDREKLVEEREEIVEERESKVMISEDNFFAERVAFSLKEKSLLKKEEQLNHLDDKIKEKIFNLAQCN